MNDTDTRCGLRIIAMCVCVAATLAPDWARAEHADQIHTDQTITDHTNVDVEWDPSVLILRGFSAVFAYGSESLPSLRFALDVFTFQSPSVQVDDNWKARAYGATAIVRYFPWGAPRGLWFAAMLRAGRWRYTYEPQNADDTVFAISAQARIGYTWFPFDNGFYVNPQVGIAVPIPVDDKPQVGTVTHSRLDPFPVPALHIGWSF